MVFDVSDVTLWSSMLAIAVASASVPIAFSLKPKGRCAPVIKYLPWIAIAAVISIMFGTAEVVIADTNLHHITESLLIGIIMLFSFKVLKEARR
jgi:hypothetical protein